MKVFTIIGANLSICFITFLRTFDNIFFGYITMVRKGKRNRRLSFLGETIVLKSSENLRNVELNLQVKMFRIITDL